MYDTFSVSDIRQSVCVDFDDIVKMVEYDGESKAQEQLANAYNKIFEQYNVCPPLDYAVIGEFLKITVYLSPPIFVKFKELYGSGFLAMLKEMESRYAYESKLRKLRMNIEAYEKEPVSNERSIRLEQYNRELFKALKDGGYNE